MNIQKMAATKSEKLHECLRFLSYSTVPSSEKGSVVSSLRKMLESEAPYRGDDDLPLLHAHNVLNAYTYLPGASLRSVDDDAGALDCGIRLPALHDFNKLMKRGYAILVWIRPLISSTFENDTRKLSAAAAAPQTLFRLATLDHRTFLQCTVSQWTFHDRQQVSAKIILTIGGTAVAAVQPPGVKSSAEAQQQLLPIHVASATLSLSTTDWQLLSISHSNPYLKRPRFTISLSGSIILDADCPYPAVNPSGNATTSYHYSLKSSSYHNNASNPNATLMDMEQVILFQNLHIPILCGSCAVLQEPIISEEPLALLAELGPCTSGSIIAHPPPVPLNRDAATVSLLSSPHCYSLGMTDSLPMDSTTAAGQNTSKSSTTGSNLQTRTTTMTSTNIEYSRIGIPSCKEGNRGADIVQQLRTKIMYEFHPWDAPHIRSLTSEDASSSSSPSRSKQRTIIPPTFIAAKLGMTENVRLGLVEPNPGSFHVLSTSSPSSSSVMARHRHAAATLSGLVVLGTGSVISNSDWIAKCQQRDTSASFDPIWNSANILRTHIAVHSLSLLILPLRLALPAPAEHFYDDVAVQKTYQHSLLRTLMEHNGSLVGEIFHLIAALFRSCGEIREEAVQSGFMYTLSSLLRRVLCRAYRCGILSSEEGNEYYISTDPVTFDGSVSPSVHPLPTHIVFGALDIVSACCGGIFKYKKQQRHGRSTVVHHSAINKESNVIPPALFLRRTSDLSLQCLHGFCFQGVLWGASTTENNSNSNWEAAAAMIKAIACRYCPSKILGTAHNPYGEFLRNHMSVQSLLDMIQWYFVLPSFNNDLILKKSEIISCGESFTLILQSLLYASLSEDPTTGVGASRSEHDIQACVAALASTSINCFVSDVILKALHGILAKCTMNTPILHWYSYPDFAAEISFQETMFSTNISDTAKTSQLVQTRDTVASRLARNLYAAEAGSIVLPMLLSRLINCGGSTATIMSPGCGCEKNTVFTDCSTSLGKSVGFFLDWRVQWRRTLLLWLWLLHSPQHPRGNDHSPSSSPYGNTTALKDAFRRSCTLLVACAKTGALKGCVSVELIDRLLPIAPGAGTSDGNESAPDSNLRGGGSVSMDRLKLILQLIPMLVCSLLPTSYNASTSNISSSISQDDRENETNESWDATLLFKLVSALQYSIQSALKLAFLQLGRRSPTTAGGWPSSSSEFGTSQGGWTSLSLSSPVKKVLLFAQRCVEALTKSALLLQPYGAKSSEIESDISGESSSDRQPYFACQTSSSINNLLSKNPSTIFLEVYEMIQETLSDVLCFVMQNISSGHSGGGGQPSIVIWKSVISAMPKNDSKCEDEGDPHRIHISDDDRVLFLCNLVSISIARLCIINEGQSKSDIMKGKATDSPAEQRLFSKEVCISLSRLAILIQEKNLLQPLESSPDRLRRWQLSLVRQIIYVLTLGREQMGWCQIQAVAHEYFNKTSNVFPYSTTMLSGSINSSKKQSNAIAGSLNLPKVRISSAPLHRLDSGTHSDLATLPSGFEETSKQYQPFLRPFLHFALQCLGYIPDTCVNLWKCMMDEIKASITAALVGLTFPCARDVGIGTLCAARWAMNKLHNGGNVRGQRICAALILLTAEELRERYLNERRLRIEYHRDDSHFLVEHMIFGSDPFLVTSASNKLDEKMRQARLSAPKTEFCEQTQATDASVPQPAKRLLDSDGHLIDNNSPRLEKSPSSHILRPADVSALTDDFILYTDALTPDATDLSRVPEIIERSGKAQLSWNSYAGFFSALEKCSFCTHGYTADVISHVLVDVDEEYFKVESYAIDALSHLSTFLDIWDDHVTRESTFDIVELFEATSVESTMEMNPLLNENPILQSWDTQNDLLKSSPYANTVAQFIELATGERQRIAESRIVMVPSIVHSSDAAAEHFVYRYRMDSAHSGCNVIPNLYEERGIGDSGKDVYSRLSSYPVHRQFPRFVPPYLDHSRSAVSLDDNNTICSSQDQQTTNNPLSPESVQGRSYSLGANSIMEQDILNVAAHIKIFDITKSVTVNECEQEVDETLKSEEPTRNNREDNMKSDTEELDGLHLGFVDRSLFIIRSSTEMDSDSHDIATLTDHSQSDAKALDMGSLPFHALKPSQQRELVPFYDSTFNLGGNVPPQVFSSTTSFAFPPAASLGTGLPVECYFENVLHVRAEGNRKATLLITGLHLILEYESDLFEGEELAAREGETCKDVEGLNKNNSGNVALRPKLTRFAIAELSQIFLRRYRLRDSALELFLVPSGGSEGSTPSVSAFLDFGPGYSGNSRRNAAGTALMKRAPSQSIKQWPERSSFFVHEHRQRLTSAWVDGRLSNFDYLLHLNTLAGRTFNDLCQYPVMPWVLSNYVSQEIPDLYDKNNFRDMSKPMGALNASRLEDFMERFETFQDPTIPPFMYGSHYSTNAGVVLHFLVRLHPYAGLHRQLQNGHFDVADRLFSSVPRTWEGCTGSSAAEVKELTPEWYCCPTFLRNVNRFKFGTSQDGVVIDDVALPPWANNSPERFIEVMRAALESDICSDMLPDWIDLIFGYKQQGPEAVKAKNVFFYLTYYGSVDVASIEDESLRTATELQIAHFGQCPMKLFWRPHPRKNINKPKVGFAEFDLFDQLRNNNAESQAGSSRTTARLYPFLNSPTSHELQLDAPPPKSNASFIAVRLAGIDKILTVDSHGIFHCFRYSWRAEPSLSKDEAVILNEESSFLIDTCFAEFDKGCFIAQRELPHFRAVPRLPHIPLSKRNRVAVALSKTLFASRTLLLALSDGDGTGGLAMQFIDPAKGLVKGEAIVPNVHNEQVTAIAMDPLGVATGGGAGGELAIVGSADGSASLWRFISSHYLPIRPKQRMRGHNGSTIHAVAISSTLNICATVSSHRCCLFSLGNGVLLCSISPPTNPCPDTIDSSNKNVSTEFSDSPAACFSILGYIILVCKSTISQKSDVSNKKVNGHIYFDRQTIITLNLFSIEGVHCGSRSLDSFVPHKIIATFDGRSVLVSRNGSVSVHLVSPTNPLTVMSEWAITDGNGENVPTFDIDIGPSLFRPVVAAAACSEGAMRLHALPGISAWSEANKKGTMSSVVGSAFAKPAEKLKQAGGIVKGIGTSIVGLGRELGREALSDVKERGVAGFLGGVFGKSTANR